MKIKIEQIENVIRLIHINDTELIENIKSDNLLSANEFNSVNYIDSSYKLNELAKHDYSNYHYKINDIVYDVYIFQDEDTNIHNLLQLILCNNYVQIIRFDQNDYNNRKYLSSFSISDKVYSFFDSMVIIIKHNNFNKDIQYKELLQK